jgi:hypothetical protein
MLKEYLEIANIHIKRANEALKNLSIIDLNSKSFDDNHIVVHIDSFIFRFIKLQDYLGKKIFPELLVKIDVEQNDMPLIDVLDRLEKIGLLPDSDRWIDYRDVRNKLTYEYPEDKTNLIAGIQEAMIYFVEIKQIVHQIETYITTHKL